MLLVTGDSPGLVTVEDHIPHSNDAAWSVYKKQCFKCFASRDNCGLCHKAGAQEAALALVRRSFADPWRSIQKLQHKGVSHQFIWAPERVSEYPSLVVSFSALCFCKQSTSTLCWQQDKTCHLPGCEWWQPYCIGLNMEGHWVKEEHERSKYMNKSITSCMFCVILCNYN